RPAGRLRQVRGSTLGPHRRPLGKFADQVRGPTVDLLGDDDPHVQVLVAPATVRALFALAPEPEALPARGSGRDGDGYATVGGGDVDLGAEDRLLDRDLDVGGPVVAGCRILSHTGWRLEADPPRIAPQCRGRVAP